MKRARWLVTATLVLALAVIALGAYTRLTDAGLGCPDWPGCYGRLTPPVHDTHIAAAQARFPDAQVDPFKARNEMVHRYLAGLLGLCVLAIFVVLRRLPRGRGLGAALLVLVVFQAALGMWTVTMNLMPVVVVAHLFGGFGVLALLALLRSELGRDAVAGGAQVDAAASGRRTGQSFVDVPEPRAASALRGPAEPRLARLLPLAWLAFAVLLAQIALGGWTSANYAAAVCSQTRRISPSACARRALSCVRTVPTISTVSAMMLKRLPPWISPNVSTSGTCGSTARETIVCAAVTTAAAATMAASSGSCSRSRMKARSILRRSIGSCLR